MASERLVEVVIVEMHLFTTHNGNLFIVQCNSSGSPCCWKFPCLVRPRPPSTADEEVWCAWKNGHSEGRRGSANVVISSIAHHSCAQLVTNIDKLSVTSGEKKKKKLILWEERNNVGQPFNKSYTTETDLKALSILLFITRDTCKLCDSRWLKGDKWIGDKSGGRLPMQMRATVYTVVYCRAQCRERTAIN